MGEAQALAKDDNNDLTPDSTDLITPEDDKTMALMGVAKTIQTVSSLECHQWAHFFTFSLLQLVDALDAVTSEASKEILLQVQEQVIPIIVLTLESSAIGEGFILFLFR